MDKIISLARCLEPATHIDIRIDEAFKGKPYKTVLYGPVEEILEQDLINPKWKIGNVLVPASGKYGTVVIYIRRNKT